MPPDESQPNPAQANNDNRAAIEAKSRAALAAAIETVSEAAPAPRQEAQPVEVEQEATETPEVSPEPTREAKPADPKPEAKPVKASAALERQARKVIRERADRRAADEARASEARAFQERDAARAEAAAAREFLDLLKADPMGAIAKAGHDPAQLVPNWLKQVATPEKTPEQIAAALNEKKLGELEAWRKAQELAQSQQAMTAQVATYQGQCAEAIADKDAFEYVHRDGGTEALYRYIEDTYQLAVVEARAGRLTTAEAKTGRYSEAQLVEIAKGKLAAIARTPPAAFAKQMEAELRGKFATPKAAAAAATTTAPAKTGKERSLLDAAKNTRGSRSLKQRSKPNAADEDDEPRALPRGGGVRTVPYRKAFTQTDLINDAIRAMAGTSGRR